MSQKFRKVHIDYRPQQQNIFIFFWKLQLWHLKIRNVRKMKQQSSRGCPQLKPIHILTHVSFSSHFIAWLWFVNITQEDEDPYVSSWKVILRQNKRLPSEMRLSKRKTNWHRNGTDAFILSNCTAGPFSNPRQQQCKETFFKVAVFSEPLKSSWFASFSWFRCCLDKAT